MGIIEVVGEIAAGEGGGACHGEDIACADFHDDGGTTGDGLGECFLRDGLYAEIERGLDAFAGASLHLHAEACDGLVIGGYFEGEAHWGGGEIIVKGFFEA